MDDVFKNFDQDLFPELSKLIFMDADKEQEWEEMDPRLKRSVNHHLNQTFSKMENKLAIELLCTTIHDLDKRISELENITCQLLSPKGESL